MPACVNAASANGRAFYRRAGAALLEDYRSWRNFVAENSGNMALNPKRKRGGVASKRWNDWAFVPGVTRICMCSRMARGFLKRCRHCWEWLDAHGDFADILSMRNAHWVRLIPLEIGSALRWRLMDYNHGPAIADTEEREHPNL